MIRKHFLTSEFAKFLLVGGIAAGVNFGIRIVLSVVMSYGWAVFIAYLFGMTTAYILSKIWVFEGSGRSITSEAYYFTIVNIIAVAQVWIISVGLAQYVFPRVGINSYSEEIAHFIGLSVPIFTSFLGHKYMSFKKKV